MKKQKTKTVELRLPQDVALSLRALAELSGLPVDACVNVLLALELRRVDARAQVRDELTKRLPKIKDAVVAAVRSDRNRRGSPR